MLFNEKDKWKWLGIMIWIILVNFGAMLNFLVMWG